MICTNVARIYIYICCLDKCHHTSWHLLKIVPKTYLESLVKIESVTAEIFLIWTNVTRTNVAWTNILVTIGNCFRCFQELTIKVLSISGQLQLRYCCVEISGGFGWWSWWLNLILSVQLKDRKEINSIKVWSWPILSLAILHIQLFWDTLRRNVSLILSLHCAFMFQINSHNL